MNLESRPLTYVLEACGGRLVCGDAEAFVQRTCTDSRKVKPEDLFVALRGDRFDGHAHVDEAALAGAVAVVVDRSVEVDCAVIEVDDTRAALGRLAARYRADFHPPVFAVAGSNGKTTTKEMLAAILRRRWEILWSEASFNNDIGVPLTLLRLEQGHRAAVLEAGTNHPGELAPLLKMIAPRYGVLTGIGREHLEFFRNIAGVAQEEGQLAELLPAGGKLFLYGDDEWGHSVAGRCAAPVVRAGFGSGNDWRAEKVRLDAEGTTFHTRAPSADWCGETRLNLLGRHQVGNALLAMAAAAELGLTGAEVREGLVACRPPHRRMQSRQVGGVRWIDDTYNANVDSMAAALTLLGELPCEGRRIAVLGDMAELGGTTQEAHAGVGQSAAEAGLDLLLTVGEHAESTAEAARKAGMEVVVCENVATTGTALRERAKPGDVVLLKASRATRLEQVEDSFRDKQ